MKRIIAFLLLCAMTLTICFSAMAWTETWTINPSSGGTFKKSPTNHAMPDSGSFWRATYVAGYYSSSSAYIYKSQHGQVTSTTPFVKGTEQRPLNYLEPKVIGDTYWIVASNKYGTQVTYEYYF